MAKKKAAAKKKTATKTIEKSLEPTKAELETIANKLIGSTKNVFDVSEDILGRKIGEEIFDMLEKQCAVFKCEQCNTWLSTSQKDRSVVDMCEECVNEINGDGDDPEFESEDEDD